MCIGAGNRILDCLDRAVCAFVLLEDRAIGLRRAQPPFRIVAVGAAFGHGAPLTERDEIEAIDEFVRRIDLNGGEGDGVETVSDGAQDVATGRDARRKRSVRAAARLLDDLFCAVAQELDERAGKRLPVTIAHGAANRAEPVTRARAVGLRLTCDCKHECKSEERQSCPP